MSRYDEGNSYGKWVGRSLGTGLKDIGDGYRRIKTWDVWNAVQDIKKEADRKWKVNNSYMSSSVNCLCLLHDNNLIVPF